MEREKKSFPKKRLIAAGIMLFLAVSGMIAARASGDFADMYGFGVYPAVVAVFARISGIFPFSVGEIMIILGVLAVLAGIVYFAVGIIRSKGKRLRLLASCAATVLLAVSAILFMFVYGEGINYSRRPFSDIAGLKTEKYTKEQLCEVLEDTVARINNVYPSVPLGADGHLVLPADLSDRARSAMSALGKVYPSLDTYYPPLKPVMMSELMCYGHITGVFSFYSMESNYNTMDVPENRGFTFCHELSHMTGFMREDEANYISVIACEASGDIVLEYSGLYNRLIYLLNAYYPEVDIEEYLRIIRLLPSGTVKQLDMENEFWDKYKTDFGEVAEAMNDVYLKINAQPEGTKSYGRVVDLIMAEYFKNHTTDEANIG